MPLNSILNNSKWTKTLRNTYSIHSWNNNSSSSSSNDNANDSNRKFVRMMKGPLNVCILVRSTWHITEYLFQFLIVSLLAGQYLICLKTPHNVGYVELMPGEGCRVKSILLFNKEAKSEWHHKFSHWKLCIATYGGPFIESW